MKRSDPAKADSPARALQRLEELRLSYGGPARERLELLLRLERRRLPTAEQVHRLHELLCFLRAYPDDTRVLTQVERMLENFAARGDLRRYRRELTDSGVAGTDIYYRCYWVMARWLARRWPQQLSIDWADFENQDRLLDMLHLLVPYTESPALDMVDDSARQWIETLRGRQETDASFLIRRFEALRCDEHLREHLYELLDVPLRLAAGAEGPSRTRAHFGVEPIVFQTGPIRRRRPRLRSHILRPPTEVRPVGARQGEELIGLAREAMITRSRDLDAFANADRRDVRLVRFENGLAFACFGTRPERRLMLESSYGFVTLKNGVPIGYVLASSLLGSTEIAYNVFETFRDAEAAVVFPRILAMVHHLLGSDAFAIDPYQLGYGNPEGLRSGAWWFYYKLGFRPHDPDVRSVLGQELRKMRADPRHRSDQLTLRRLSSDYMFFYLGRPRRNVLGRIALGNIGLRVSAYLASRFGADREAGLATCSAEAMELLERTSLSRRSPGERLAWQRWSPLVRILPGLESWSRAERRALAAVVLAKGGRRESDFTRLFDQHPRLAKALAELAKEATGT